MKKSLFILVMVLSLSLNLGLLGMIAWHHLLSDRFCQESLGLSKEKAAEMTELRRSVMNKMRPIGQELSRERRELIHLLFEPEPNRAEIDQRVKNIQVLQGKIHLMLIEHMLSAKENLTPAEQRKFFRFILKKMDSYQPGPFRSPPMRRGGR